MTPALYKPNLVMWVRQKLTAHKGTHKAIWFLPPMTELLLPNAAGSRRGENCWSERQLPLATDFAFMMVLRNLRKETRHLIARIFGIEQLLEITAFFLFTPKERQLVVAPLTTTAQVV